MIDKKKTFDGYSFILYGIAEVTMVASDFSAVNTPDCRTHPNIELVIVNLKENITNGILRYSMFRVSKKWVPVHVYDTISI